MAAKKKSGISKLIVSTLTAIPELIRFINHIATYIQIEARALGRKISLLLLLSLFVLTLLLTIWFSMNGMLFIWLLSFQFSLLTSLLIVTGVNVVLLVLTGLSMIKVKNQLH